MSPTLLNRTGLVLVAVVAAVGLVDAAIGGVWDLAVVCALVVASSAALLLRLSFRRRSVPVRADLARWLERYASEGGEQVEAVADRAISAYRDGLTAGTEASDDAAAVS